MRYMMLVYSTEGPDGLPPDEAARIMTGHQKVIEEATRKGVLAGAEPLAPTSTATTVRLQDGKALVTDGPFAETKEHLAGYYIMECDNLDEAIEWAAKNPHRLPRGRRLHRDSAHALALTRGTASQRRKLRCRECLMSLLSLSPSFVRNRDGSSQP